MNRTNENEPQGSKRGVATSDCNPRVKKRLQQIFKNLGKKKSKYRKTNRIFPWHISFNVIIKVEKHIYGGRIRTKKLGIDNAHFNGPMNQVRGNKHVSLK